MESIAVVLVHGWKSHPGVWRRLIEKLSLPPERIWSFEYTHLDKEPVRVIARELQVFIRNKRAKENYLGKIDIVCHSMGGCVARFYIEVLDGERREEKIRQVIEIGVPNRGSSMAEIFNDPTFGPEIIRILTGEFVPDRYIPAHDTNVQGIRIRSGETSELVEAGLRTDIIYRNICAANRTGDPEFFPSFQGKTWVLYPDKSWGRTWLGDGVIPHADSYLPGTGFDVVPEDPDHLEAPSYQYCHIYLPKNPEVIRLVKKYIENPEIPSSLTWPE
ncbi:MAG: acetyltransferase [Methanospirillum sp.]|nr:acetyltransferase [Methanospirillum sp.]